MMHDVAIVSRRYLAFLGRLLVGYVATGAVGGAVVVAGTAAWTHHWGGFALSLAAAAACVETLRRAAPWRPPTFRAGRGA